MDIKTPAYVFDINTVVNRIKFIKSKLPNIRLSYAMKANPYLVEFLIDYVDSFEVCSPGEYQICKSVNVRKDKIVLSGVFKDPQDIENIVKECGDKPVYTIESIHQCELLNRIAKQNDLTLKVFLRLSSGNQFGMDEDTIKNIIYNKDIYSFTFLGLQSYSGTQKKDDQITKELAYIKEFQDSLNIDFKEFEYGPGLKVNYFTSDQPINEESQLSSLFDALSPFMSQNIQLEMGRYIAYSCGEYHTSIVDIKQTKGVNYCIIDGGINHLNYYGQTMAMKPPFIKQLNGSGEIRNYTICGALCTVADVIIRNYPLTNPKIGDELVFYNVGAYSITEGIYLFLSRTMPAVFIKTLNGDTILARKPFDSYKLNYNGGI